MKKQKMIRWLAWAVAGIACVAGGIHVNQKYQEREAAIRAIEARAQAKSQEEEDLANGILTWNGKIPRGRWKPRTSLEKAETPMHSF